jgi:DNA-binding NtrC family response regulator
MEEMNGLDFIAECRTIRQDIPAVLCTGFDKIGDSRAQSVPGLLKAIGKPVTISEIALAARGLLDPYEKGGPGE